MSRKIIPFASLAVLFLLVVAVSSWTAIRALAAEGPLPPSLLLFKQAVLVFDYFQMGFVRRGLGGAIAGLFGDVADPRSALLFHIFSAVFLALPVVLLVASLAARAPRLTVLFFSVFLLASPHLFRSWAADLARTDMLVCGFIAWAAFAMIQARPTLAAVSLVTGYLAHETAVLFGAPLVAALAYVGYRNGDIARPALLRACGTFAVSLAAIALALRYAVSPERIAAVAAGARAQLPALEVVDAALYVQLSGWRGLKASICANFFLSDRYWLYLAALPAVVGIHFPVFGAQTRLSIALFAFAAMLPAVGLSLIALDLGRWACFGIFNAWLLAVAMTVMRPEWLRPVASGFWIRVAVLALVVVAQKHGDFSPSWAIDALANRTGVPQKWDGEIDRCDPGWKEYLLSTLKSAKAR